MPRHPPRPTYRRQAGRQALQEKNKARKAAKSQRKESCPPLEVVSDHNFFASLRLCENQNIYGNKKFV